jgi:hypothetical protein
MAFLVDTLELAQAIEALPFGRAGREHFGVHVMHQLHERAVGRHLFAVHHGHGAGEEGADFIGVCMFGCHRGRSVRIHDLWAL